MKIIKLPNGGQIEEYKSGNKLWHLNGKLHREDGPAIEYTNGDKYWYLNGKLHREDGPAVEYHDYKEWYINDELVECNSQEEFKRLMKLRAFW
jgi:hypothetical protein